MNQEERLNKLSELNNCSPLEMSSKIIELELYDMKSSQEIIDEVYEMFSNGGNLVEEVLKPSAVAVIDRMIGKKGKLGKKVSNPTSLLDECEMFSYEDDFVVTEGVKEEFFAYDSKNNPSEKYDGQVRNKYDASYSDKMKYKDKAFGNKVNVKSAYDGSNVHKTGVQADKRRKCDANKHLGEYEHIVSIKEIHTRYSDMVTVMDHDLKKIANSDTNVTIVSKSENTKKKDMAMKEYIKSEKHEYTSEQKKNMKGIDKKARINTEVQVNKTAAKNLITNKSIREKSAEHIKEKGNEAVKDLTKGMQGDICMFIFKPLYYELKDSFLKGIAKGVGATSIVEGFGYRIRRVKDYIFRNAKNFFGDSISGFLKGLADSMIKAVLSLFTGVIKNIYLIAKEGIKLIKNIGSAFKSGNLSRAEKGDMIVKAVGTSLIAIVGFQLDDILEKASIPEPWSDIIAAIVTGAGVSIFMYMMNKIDLFSVKAEKRHARIKEIFDERINDINEAVELFNVEVISRLKRQHQQFGELNEIINEGLDSDDINLVNENLYRLADFFKAEVIYRNTQEFVNYFDTSESIVI